MATIKEYIYEQVLLEELKLNKLSNKLGKIILPIYNSLSNIEDGEKYDKYIDVLKRIRVELLEIEKKYYKHDIDADKMKMYFSSYIKGLNKVKKELGNIDDRKLKRVLDKIDDLVDKLKHLKVML